MRNVFKNNATVSHSAHVSRKEPDLLPFLPTAETLAHVVVTHPPCVSCLVCLQQSADDVSQFDSKFTSQTPVDSPDDSTLSESANQVFLVPVYTPTSAFLM